MSGTPSLSRPFETGRHVFVADVHLSRDRLDRRDAFIRLVGDLADADTHLYLLGDLFDLWVGPGQFDTEPEWQPVLDALRTFVDSDGLLTYCHGNRDYFMGDHLTHAVGAETVTGHKVITLDGRRVYIGHGDALCTEDHAYHAMTWFIRGGLVACVWRWVPVEWQHGFSRFYRDVSSRQAGGRRPSVHGVNPRALDRLCRRGIDVVICGHVHRRSDSVRRCRLDGRDLRLITLEDWDERGNFLTYAAGEFRMSLVDFT